MLREKERSDQLLRADFCWNGLIQQRKALCRGKRRGPVSPFYKGFPNQHKLRQF